MEPIRLFIQNFQCHDESFIDFTKFQSALIVGKVDNNDERSNGVGKTTIFKALEYVLFNQSEVNLENIIREDTEHCTVTFDFFVDNCEYRVSRKRTKKSTDLSLFVRNNTEASDTMPDISEYKDISSRRVADTEKDLFKLTKFTYKSFRNIVHFPQDVKDGLSSTTPEKRKAILKDVLDIINYSKLEKIAKDKLNSLQKELDKYNILLSNLQDPFTSLKSLEESMLSLNNSLLTKDNLLSLKTEELQSLNSKIDVGVENISSLEKECADVLYKEKSLLQEISKLDLSLKDYSVKKNTIIKNAKELVLELDELKKEQKSILNIDYSTLEPLIAEADEISEKIQKLKNNINVNELNISNLLIPLPKDNKCKHCRQDMSAEHKKTCQENIDKELAIIRQNNSLFSNQIADFTKELLNKNKQINYLQLYKKKLEDVNSKISLKNKEVSDRKVLYSEYLDLISKYTSELDLKKKELEVISQRKEELPLSKINELKNNITHLKNNSTSIHKELELLKKEKDELLYKKAALEFSISEKNKSCVLYKEYSSKIESLIKESRLYPKVIQAFSSSGIPNIIIQNVLDDLQIEANNLLNQLRPGLQLSFTVEKTKSDGSESETLDIAYSLNGKNRYYEQLSGAMKLAVSFSLKLGLSFVLQKLIGVNVRFFLLDEIDQALDRATIDAFADMIKLFQNNFKFLIITHNDHLKEKFSSGIVVQQNISMISNACVVSSW